MTSVSLWTNLLIWDEVEQKGGQFDASKQLWLDNLVTTHCYQKILDDEPVKDTASLNVQFTSSSSTPKGSEDEVHKTMTSILQQLKRTKTSSTTPLASLSSVKGAEANECGYGCYGVSLSASAYNRLKADDPIGTDNKVSF